MGIIPILQMDIPGLPLGDPAFVDASQAKVGTGAVELDGNDSVVMNGFRGITGTKARTCMAWIKTTADGFADRVLGRQECGRGIVGYAGQRGRGGCG